MCQNGAGHKPMNEDSKNCEHTIVPYSVAIKRMAEILIYKANECLAKVSKLYTLEIMKKWTSKIYLSGFWNVAQQRTWYR